MPGGGFLENRNNKKWLDRRNGGRELIRHIVFVDFFQKINPIKYTEGNPVKDTISYFLVRLVSGPNVEYTHIYDLGDDYVQPLSSLHKAAILAIGKLVDLNSMGILERIIIPSILNKGYFYYNTVKFLVENLVVKENNLVINGTDIYSISRPY